MTTGSKENYVEAKPCSCQGLNRNCFRCEGSGRYFPKLLVSPEFNEFAYRAKIKKEMVLAKKCLLKKEKAEKIISPKPKSMLEKKIVTLALGKETKRLFDKLKFKPSLPVDKYAGLIWKEAYYCTKCNKYLKRVELVSHYNHFEQILEKPTSKSPTKVGQKNKK